MTLNVTIQKFTLFESSGFELDPREKIVILYGKRVLIFDQQIGIYLNEL